MSAAARLAAVVAFALAYLSQPFALDACALSCEAARAASGPVLAAPCHHTSSCAVQITQPTASGAAATIVAVVPTIAVTAVERQPVPIISRSFRNAPSYPNPPPTPLRV